MSETDYVAAAMVACPRCKVAIGSPCRKRGCRNGYINCDYAVCAIWVELPQPHLERAVKARQAALTAVPAPAAPEGGDDALDPPVPGDVGRPRDLTHTETTDEEK